MTVDAFLAWDAPPGCLWQLVEGMPRAMAPPTPTHGAIQSRIDRLIGAFLEQQARRCVVVTTPVVVPGARSEINALVPDLAVTCSPIGPDGRVLKDPVLLIEILSPANQAETWTNVWAYTTIPSVREIVVIRSVAVGALILRRGADGSWPDQAVEVSGGELVMEYRFPVAAGGDLPNDMACCP